MCIYIPSFVGFLSHGTDPLTIHSCFQMERLNGYIKAQYYVQHQQYEAACEHWLYSGDLL